MSKPSSILRHLGLWAHGVRVSPTTDPPAAVPVKHIIEPWLDVEDLPGRNPFPDYDAEPVLKHPVLSFILSLK
ncbi:MAG: hypothetical protein WCO42_01075 [bacterium]